MIEDKNLSVPYIVYEGEQARHERTMKRMIIALVIAILVTLLSNVAWLLYMSGYDFYDTSDDIMIESRDGIANYIGNDGEIDNGVY